MFPSRIVSVLGKGALENNYSVSFDGTNDYIEISSAFQVVTESGERTVSAWVKAVDTTPVDESDRGRIFNLYKADNSTSFGITAEGSGDPAKWHFFYRKTGDIFQSIDSGISVTTDWIHLVLTQNGETVKFYTDGQLRTTKTDGTYVFSSSSNASIGGHLQASGNIQEFGGKIDEVSIWDTALSAGDVSALYQAKGTSNLNDDSNSANLKGWWRMGDGTLDEYPLIGDEVTPTLGSELIGDSTFDDSSYWTFSGVGEGETFDVDTTTPSKLVAAAAQDCRLAKSGILTSGKLYKFQIVIDSYTDGRIGGADSISTLTGFYPTGAGTYTRYVVASGANFDLNIDVTADFTATDISMKEVNGNPGMMTNMASEDIAEDTP